MKTEIHTRIVEILGSTILADERKLFLDTDLSFFQVDFLSYKIETMRDVLDAFIPNEDYERQKSFLELLIKENSKCKDEYFDDEKPDNKKRGIVAGHTEAIQLMKGILYGE